MRLVVDHCFMLVTPGAPGATRLIELGLVEGPGNRHPGQGSANRRFFFANGMLELLWVHDVDEARTGPGRDLRLVERAGDLDASPFGLILRSAGAAAADATPFAGWTYQPDYFAPPRAFHVGANSADLREPLCIYLPFALPPPAIEREQTNSDLRIERLRLATPTAPGSAVLAALAAVERLDIVTGEDHRLDITLDGAGCVPDADLRPVLPLRLVRRFADPRDPVAPDAGARR